MRNDEEINYQQERVNREATQSWIDGREAELKRSIRILKRAKCLSDALTQLKDRLKNTFKDKPYEGL